MKWFALLGTIALTGILVYGQMRPTQGEGPHPDARMAAAYAAVSTNPHYDAAQFAVYAD